VHRALQVVASPRRQIADGGSIDAHLVQPPISGRERLAAGAAATDKPGCIRLMRGDAKASTPYPKQVKRMSDPCWVLSLRAHLFHIATYADTFALQIARYVSVSSGYSDTTNIRSY
jgi:hypothetical protein